MLRAAAALVLACPLLGAVVASPTYADYASECSAPTRTLSGGGTSSIAVQAGETVLVTGGTFVGGVDAFPAGSTLCVSPTATLASSYLNNASGRLVIAAGGTVELPSIVVATGFALDNEGTFTVDGLNINGASTLTNARGARFVVDSSFSPAAGVIVNNGTLQVHGALDLDSQASVTNAGLLEVDGSVDLDGRLLNFGAVLATGAMRINAGAYFNNSCAVVVEAGLDNDAAGSANVGLVRIAGAFSNNGGWAQGTAGVLAAASLGNDGAVTGYGRYRFAGNTSTQGAFVGDAASDPIVVDDRTPPSPPAIFDVQSGTVSNVVAADVTLPPPGVYPYPDCAVEPRVRSADVETTKSAPGRVEAGDPVTFTVTVTNHGPDPAAGVEVTDDLPANLVAPVTASDGGVVAGDTVTWDLGMLAVDETATLTVSGTAPAGGLLVNTVTSSATTADASPQNNDGTATAARTRTVVVPDVPDNSPPVAQDFERTTTTGRLIVSPIVDATDPDPDTVLRYSKVTSPQHGRAAVFAGGTFSYRSVDDFTGVDTFDYRACDNGIPVLCDTATITIDVYPLAWGDRATTAVDTPVRIAVQDNDTDGAEVVATSAGPSDGTVVVQPDGTITYSPDAGFVGVDAFSYEICSPTAPDLCAEARVQVVVLPLNHRPEIDDQTLATDTGLPVAGRAAGSDPDGDDLTYRLTFPPAHGTATVGPDGALRYEPESGYAGHDVFGVTVCDDGRPPLCSSAVVRVDVYPEAVDDRATTPEDTSVTIDVVDNDSGSHVRPVVVDGPASGTVEVSGDQLVYTPDPGFAGTDRFDYRLCTPGPDPLCRTATVTVTVVPDDQGGGGDGDGDGDGDGNDNGGNHDGPSGPLPDTGGPAFWLSAMGALMVAGGGAVLMAARRRRTGPTPSDA